jgi:actin-like ATPase involved in cell morphogenesis
MQKGAAHSHQVSTRTNVASLRDTDQVVGAPHCVQGVEPNAVTQQLMSRLGQQGVQSVETQQVAAAALSAVFAAAGGMLMRVGMF